MGHFTVNNIAIKSIVSCVPKEKLDNLNDSNIHDEHGKKILATTGIRYRHVVIDETTADLCERAANNLFDNTAFRREDVEVLVFVTQTPDYILPATALILQDKLDLGSHTIAFDVGLGCSGYVYGLSIISALLEKSTNPQASALLLVGDTISSVCNEKDLSTYPLFGDAGTATILEKDLSSKIEFELFSDGKGAKTIIVEDGGFRNKYSSTSEDMASLDGINFRRKKDLYLSGMDVFSFGISKVPKAIKKFWDTFNVKKQTVDFYVFHQANMFMNEKIRKKLSLSETQVPYTLFDYANVSSATIPLTISSKIVISPEKPVDIIACGFGVGLSWGVAKFHLAPDTYLKTVTY